VTSQRIRKATQRELTENFSLLWRS
jgi:hypothetical protein